MGKRHHVPPDERVARALAALRDAQGGEYRREVEYDQLVTYCVVTGPGGKPRAESTTIKGNEEATLDKLELSLRNDVSSTNGGNAVNAKATKATKATKGEKGKEKTTTASGWGDANGTGKSGGKKRSAKEKPAKSAANDKLAKLASAPLTRKGAYAADAKITVLAKENPRRPGTHGHKVFGMYARLKTVGKVLEAGGKVADLRWDEKHEYIKIG